ncbi:MAG: EVE domain-containing protein [Planctomycetota bacterium]
MSAAKRNYWLMKSEPDVFSYADLEASKKKTTLWDGVRNYQARNFMRDEMKVGDGVLFYHSNAKPPGVAGVAKIVREAYADPTQYDPKDKHYDPKSDPEAEAPRWLCVDIQAVRALPEEVSLEALRGNPKLDGMELLRRGSRLSVQPVSAAHWRAVLSQGGVSAKL